jgi:hypothetical protein
MWVNVTMWAWRVSASHLSAQALLFELFTEETVELYSQKARLSTKSAHGPPVHKYSSLIPQCWIGDAKEYSFITFGALMWQLVMSWAFSVWIISIETLTTFTGIFYPFYVVYLMVVAFFWSLAHHFFISRFLYFVFLQTKSIYTKHWAFSLSLGSFRHCVPPTITSLKTKSVFAPGSFLTWCHPSFCSA